MKFKINDAVAVLDDDLSGTITSIQGSEITVATSTGFDLVFDSNELVKIKENLMGVHSLFSNTSLDSLVSFDKGVILNISKYTEQLELWIY